MPEPPRYTWDERARRYRGPSGRFVRVEAVRDAHEAVLKGAKAEADRLTSSLIDGRISIAEWQMGMARQVKATHTASAASARGGWAQMSQSDWGAVGARVRRQYEFLQNFAAEVESGKQKKNGQALRRARMYVDAGRGTYQDMRRRMAANAGNTESRRVLGVADHCPDCIEWASWGWQPIGTLPRIGESVCRTNCKCHEEYRNAQGEVTR